MTISINGVNSLTVKAIEAMVGDAIYKNHAYLARLEKKKKAWYGAKLSQPFNYLDDASSVGGYYAGGGPLSLDQFDPLTSLEHDLKQLEQTLVINHEDLALNSGKAAILNLIEERVKLLEKGMRQQLTKGIYSDGTVSTGALNANQLIGQAAFLKSSSVSYGGLTDTDIATHAAYVAANSGTPRAITTALIQTVIGGASEGNIIPQLAICRQNVMNFIIELIKPNQRTVRENTLNGLGHDGNTLVYSGLDFITDNLSIASSVAFINEDYVRLYVHPSYDMKVVSMDNLETQDAIAKRLFWKGAYACSVLRYQGKLEDIGS